MTKPTRHIYSHGGITRSLTDGVPTHALCGHIQIITDPNRKGKDCKECVARFVEHYAPHGMTLAHRYEPPTIYTWTLQRVETTLVPARSTDFPIAG